MAYPTEGNDFIDGTAGNDSIDGLGGNDIIAGFDGHDTLNGGTGADSLRGGNGNDIYLVDAARDEVVEAETNAHTAAGRDLVRSSVSYSLSAYVEDLLLTGLTAAIAKGNSLDNRLWGNAAANMINGAGGADRMIGRDGADTYIVNHIGDRVLETNGNLATGGNDLVRSSVGFTLGNHVERLTLIGSAAIDATGNELANIIIGNVRANRLDGGQGADRLQGGAGNDVYIVNVAGDTVVEEARSHGRDTVESAVDFTLGSFVENLTLTGGAVRGVGNELANKLTGNSGADELIGNEGEDELNGLAGADVMRGGADADTYFVESIDDRIVEEASATGRDKVYTSLYRYTIDASVEEVQFRGTGDFLGVGNGLDNSLTGGNGNDVLRGMTGDDVFIDSQGDDRSFGGAGKDTFFFSLGFSHGIDRIADFVPEDDEITLSVFPYWVSHDGAGPIDEFELTIGTRADDEWDRLIYNPQTGAFLFDSDGIGEEDPVLIAQLKAGTALTYEDIFIIFQ